jgi:drug/metabolite transporter, DME family
VTDSARVLADDQKPQPSVHVSLSASLLAVGAGVTWSFGALSARLADHSDTWQYLLWRSVGVLVVIELVSLRRRGRRGPMLLRTAFTSGRMMMVANVGLLVASLAYVYAVKTTTAANAAFLSSITPLVAVVLARIVLGERLTHVTVGAIAIAMAGLVVMVYSDVDAGNMTGNVAALLSSVGFAVYTICVRSGPERDWSAVMPGYAAMMIALCSVVTAAHGRALMLPLRDTCLALMHGGLLIVVGTLLFNSASKAVPAVAMTVFAQSETVFSPLWVFAALGERPKVATLVGAALILAAVIGKAVLDAPPRSVNVHA